MVTTFCQSGAVLAKAGLGRDDSISGGLLLGETEFAVDEWIQEAESTINVLTRYNWTDVYGTLDNDVKHILRACCANLAAIPVVTFNMAGYSTRIEAEDVINVLRDSALRELSILRDKRNQLFLSDPTTGAV